MTQQHSLPGGPLRPYLGRTFTGWIAPAWPGARTSQPAIRCSLGATYRIARQSRLQRRITGERSAVAGVKARLHDQEISREQFYQPRTSRDARESAASGRNTGRVMQMPFNKTHVALGRRDRLSGWQSAFEVDGRAHPGRFWLASVKVSQPPADCPITTTPTSTTWREKKRRKLGQLAKSALRT